MTAVIICSWIAMAAWLIFGRPYVDLYNNCWLFLVGATLGHAGTLQ